MPKIPPPPSDSEALAILQDALIGGHRIELILQPLYAFTLASMLQLVMRHPHLSSHMHSMAEAMVQLLIEGIVRATGNAQIGYLMECGYDREYDRDENGNPIGPNPKTTLNLVELVRQAVPQIYGRDERMILSEFLNRTVECFVEIDLEEVIQTEKK